MVCEKELVFLNEKIAKKLFKSEKYGKILSARVISDILEADYEEVYNNIKLSSEEIAFSALTVNSTSDVIYYNDTSYINIELNFYQSDSKKRQLDSYTYQLYLGQLHTYKNYYKIKKIIQISLDTFDYFGYDDFIYNIYFMEEKHKIIETDDIHKIHVNLAYLRKLDYTKVVNGTKLMKDLYFLTCNDDDKLDIVYEGDNLMDEIIKEAKEIAGIEKMNLYLTDEEIHKQDEEHYYELGVKEGIAEKQKQVILNMNNMNMPINSISKVVNLSVQEVQSIIDESKKN